MEQVSASSDQDQNVAIIQPDDDPVERVSASTILAIFFMGMSYVPAISMVLVLPAGILEQIGQSLGDTENIVWIPGGWSVASAVSFAIAGGFSDIFGRRYVLIAGQVITLIGAIVGATAQKTTIVAAGSTIAGFGAGVIFVSYPGITELLPNKYRGAGIGWTEFCMNIPWNCLGVLLANELVLHASWRWCYYIAIMYSVVCIAGTAIFYFPPSRPRNDYDKSRWQEFIELDFIGLGLFAAGLTIFLVGLTYLGLSTYSKALVGTTITVGAIVFAACFIYDFTIPKNPIFPFHLFAMMREFTVHLIILFIAGMIWQAVTTLAPQGTLYMYTNDGIRIGVTQIPSNMSGVLGGWILPSLVHKIKHVRYQIILALVIQTVFTACYAAVVPNHRYAWMILQFFGQACFTWVTSLAYVASGLFVPQEELGVSAGLIGTFRSAGGSVGNAIFSTIVNSLINKNLAPNIAAAAITNGYSESNLTELIPAVIKNAVGVPFAFAKVPGATETVVAATAKAFKDTYAHAFRTVFLSTIPFGIIGLVAAWFVKDPSHLLNNHIAIHQEKEVLSGKKTVHEEQVEVQT
ncbi:putative efflux pump antibiotic resistance protein [Mollisia scopiformis]|uniref:Putative efflux pump antibiotic resistance protein n=1 Tax=Mollisia scopiformis TaxID=149040 RepID=A0A194WYA4_MOLSC|nr:putative efflux pump antibiotic resistance protein [Mollisia scopiformis]KUJ12948.1 putative efflux pump antibiotic resistance protein [Mollisia scopiformis]